MKLLIKLVIVAAVLHATWRLGSAYWDHYQFEDAVKESAQFSERRPVDEIKRNIANLAEKLEIPVDVESLAITKEHRRISIDGAYSREIELLPRYTRHWEFPVHVNVLSVN